MAEPGAPSAGNAIRDGTSLERSSTLAASLMVRRAANLLLRLSRIRSSQKVQGLQFGSWEAGLVAGIGMLLLYHFLA